MQQDEQMKTLVANFALCDIRIKTDIQYSHAFMLTAPGQPAEWGFATARIYARDKANSMAKAIAGAIVEVVPLRLA